MNPLHVMTTRSTTRMHACATTTPAARAMRSAVRARAPGLAGARRGQRGTVMLVALLILAVSLMLGASALESTSVQEKMSANTRDRAAAFESQETTAKNAQDYMRWLIGSGKPLPDNSAGYYVSRTVADAGGTLTANADTATLAWWSTQGLTASNSIETTLPATSTFNQKGRFLIEHMRFSDETEPGSPTIYEPSYKTIVVTGRGSNGGEVTSQTTLIVLPR